MITIRTALLDVHIFTLGEECKPKGTWDSVVMKVASHSPWHPSHAYTHSDSMHSTFTVNNAISNLRGAPALVLFSWQVRCRRDAEGVGNACLLQVRAHTTFVQGFHTGVRMSLRQAPTLHPRTWGRAPERSKVLAERVCRVSLCV